MTDNITGIRRHKGIVSPMEIDISSSSEQVTYNDKCSPFKLSQDEERKFRQAVSDVKTELKTISLNEHTKDIREYNESNRLSFYDENGNRYINSIYDYFSDGKPYYRSFLSKIKEFYKHISRYPEEHNYKSFDVRYQFVTGYLKLTAGDFWIIDEIFYDSGNLEVLRANHYNYFREGRRYRSAKEKEYCQAVTNVLTEIMIRTFNFERYYKAQEGHEEWILEEINKHYSDHVNEANDPKSCVKRKAKIEDSGLIFW